MVSKNKEPAANRLLTTLVAADVALLAPHLREVVLFPGDVLHKPGEPMTQVYFLTGGIVSLMVMLAEGRAVETVGSAAAFLRNAGAIASRRGRITIVDRPRLKELVCECYPTIRRAIDDGFKQMRLP